MGEGKLPESIALDVVTPERRVLTLDVDEVVLPGSEGYLGVRPGHTPLLTGLGTGVLSWRAGRREGALAVALGFAEVLPDRVAVLAETAESEEEIDTVRARAAQERAEARVARLGDIDIDADRALAALVRARVRLTVAARRKAGGAGS